ncbi:MAG: YgfZ/GcvT domain-containing protein [Solirubrobacteraceae bacterium]
MSDLWIPDPAEDRAARKDAVAFDRSDRGKLALSGEDAAELLDGLLSNDIGALADGEGCWATLLTPKGRMLAEVRVLRCEDEYALDTDRVSLQALWDALNNMQIGHRVALHKRTLQRGLLSLLGPRAAALTGVEPGQDELQHVAGELDRVPVRVVRSAFGVDLFCLSEHTARLTLAIGARIAGEATVEGLRIELGRPRFEVDMDETTMPQEAGIHARTVSYSKGCYIGQETVARLYWKGKPNRHLRLLECSEALPPGSALEFNGAQVGRVTSSVLSPVRGPLALALLRRGAPPEAELHVQDGAATAIVRAIKADHIATGA